MSIEVISASRKTDIPLDERQSGALYARLSEMGARVLGVGKPWRFAGHGDEEVLAIAGEASRFDFRLLYVLVEFLATKLDTIDPFKLRRATAAMKTPEVWGVIGEYVAALRRDDDARDFFSIVLRGRKAVPHQMYWTPWSRPRPEKMREMIARTPDAFWKWGFISDEVPITKEARGEVAKERSYSKERRVVLLSHLLKEKGAIAVSDYLQALGNSISRQQAHKDLTSFPGIVAVSDRRGRRYRAGRRR